MSKVQLLLGQAGTLLLVTTVIGLLARGRFRIWYSFALYLLVVASYSVLVSVWPSRFYRPTFWLAHEIALTLLRLSMALELGARAFRAFPGALATARSVILVILGATFAAIAIPASKGDYVAFVGDLLPRLLNGSIWLFTALAVLILWYRLPVHWFPKAVLLSYVPFLLVFTIAMNMLGDLGWQRGQWVDLFSQCAYVALLMYWTYTAWRRDPVARGPVGPDRQVTP